MRVPKFVRNAATGLALGAVGLAAVDNAEAGEVDRTQASGHGGSRVESSRSSFAGLGKLLACVAGSAAVGVGVVDATLKHRYGLPSKAKAVDKSLRRLAEADRHKS